MAVPARSCLLVVADYPYVVVGGKVFAEIPWDESFARPYLGTFEKILLLGRRRHAAAPPAGWVPVDDRFYEVLDAGDWTSIPGFLRTLPAIRRALSANWERIGVLYLKLFYLDSLAAWWYNQRRPQADRKPVATLLVGDSAEAVSIRSDLFPLGPLRTFASTLVAAIIRFIQRRVTLAGYVARFLVNKFADQSRPMVLANESWLHEGHISRHERTGPRHPATLLFVGRLIPRKRAHLLVDATGRLVREGRAVQLVVVGDGPERRALERQIRELGLEDRVRFTGWLGLLTTPMLQIYDSADIFCLPSYAEGLPLVIVEAMGRGVPVIATAVSGTPEAVEHESSGLLIPRDDADALTAALRRLLDDRGLWRRCVDGGYAVASKNTFEVQRGILARAITALAR